MILYDFEYERPDSLEQASADLRRLGKGARLAAGGTALYPSMRVENDCPTTVVSVGALTPAAPVRQSDGSIRIDALMRLAALERNELIRDALPMLSDAAGVVAGAQIRHMATLGGNLCQDTRCLYLNQKHDYQFKSPCYKRGGDLCFPYPNNTPDTCWSVHMSDTAPALIALNAQVEILGEGGLRRASLESLYTGSGLSPIGLASDEILRAIVVPAVGDGFGWGYRKSARRGGMEFGISVMAVALSADKGAQTCGSARIVIGAIREAPIRATQAEQVLGAAPLDEATIARAAAAAAGEIRPLPHHGFTRSYIRDDLRVKIRRVLQEAAARALGSAVPHGGFDER